MKFAYKVIKNKNNTKENNKVLENIITKKTPASVLSFILVAKMTLGFRECSKIVQIAQDTECKIEIASGTKVGTSESILSLASLGISADKSLVLTIKGERNDEAFHKVSKIISGEVEC